MSKITYTDKEYIYKNDSIPEINKITDVNMNEIKRVVNANDDRLITAETDINNAEAVIGNETDTYSANSTYVLDSLVIYGGLLYKCTTAITVAEAWTIAHWTQVNLTSLVQSRNAYSTTEQVIGTWIDGKPIYRKVLLIGTIGTSATYSLPTNIENLGFFTKMDAIVMANDSTIRPIPNTAPGSSNYNTSLFYGNGNIYIQTSSLVSFSSGYIILEYIKTS